MVVVNVYYSGENGAARRFADRVRSEGVLAEVRSEIGCERYEYYISSEGPERVLLVERWADIPSFEAHKAGGPLERIHRIQEGPGCPPSSRGSSADSRPVLSGVSGP